MNKKFWKILSIALLGYTLSACSSLSDKDRTEGWSANQLYQTAKEALNSGRYEDAVKYYEILESRYPLGRYAQQAQLESAYAYHKYEEPDNALDTIDRYIRMNPTANNVDYALYLRGLVNFSRGSGLLDRFFPRSIADLDSVRQKEAFHDFSRLVNRYPQSKYRADALQRIQHLRNTLAQSEVNVARYYMDRSAYLAAFNRAEYAIKHYQGAPSVIDALEIKIRAARQLGKNDLADANLRVLQQNFPERAAKFR
ncbi:MAG TPA: outer membrane protein assembly factor BamD [Thiothrix sp.]|nr:outer membrane protein assembly factor BamD [Thiothrix sp.]